MRTRNRKPEGQGRGALPLETLLLSIVLVLLLLYPLLKIPSQERAIATYRGELADVAFLSGQLRLWDLRELHGAAYRGRSTEGRAVAASFALQQDPGWPRPDDASLVARQLDLPEGWTVLRLVFEDFGVTTYDLNPAELTVEVTFEHERTERRSEATVSGNRNPSDPARSRRESQPTSLRGYPAHVQLASLPRRRASVARLKANFPTQIHLDGATPTSHQFAIVFTEEFQLADLSSAALSLGRVSGKDADTGETRERRLQQVPLRWTSVR